MRRTIAILSLGAALAVLPQKAAAAGIEVRLGGFVPRADSTLFRDTDELFGATKSDWRGVTGGVEFAGQVARNVELGVSVDGYSRTLDTAYVDFRRERGGDILQTLKLTTVPVGVTLRFISDSRRASLRPYVGAGASLVFWKYEEFGDFIDFSTPEPHDIVSDSFRSDGVKPAFHVAGGVRFRITYDLSLTAEGRYQWAQRVVMGDDFAPNAPGLENTLDLTGASFTVGLNLRF